VLGDLQPHTVNAGTALQKFYRQQGRDAEAEAL
jgi:hypothetical protein